MVVCNVKKMNITCLPMFGHLFCHHCCINKKIKMVALIQQSRSAGKKKLETVAGHLKANSNLDTCPIVSMLCKNENLFFVVVIYPEFNMTTVHYLSKYLTLPAVSSLTFLRKPTRKRTLKFNPAFPLLKYLERLLVNTITLDSISGYNLIQ